MRVIQRVRRVAAVALAALVAVVALPAGPARAWTWQYRVVVFQSSLYCIKADAGIDHWQPGVFSGNLAYVNTYVFMGDCVTVRVLEARVSLQVQKFDEATGKWRTCKSSDYVYGMTGSDVWGPYGPGTAVNYGGSACGPGAGWYRTKARAEIRNPFVIGNPDVWMGGAAYSGEEWVP
ncbi:hypothetical protein [Sphaerisporangium sp. NPDC051011]|uniref:hypothetical protein n=1 Tax=Sphaerisporangium sp. NPDC051011 TaxID=3155792 RepID=UPI0033C744EB